MVSLTINGSSQNQTLDGTISYDSITIINGGTLFVTAYNGSGTTGTLTLNVTGDINVDSASSIIGDARGFRGGNGGFAGSCNSSSAGGGYGGEGPGGGQKASDTGVNCYGAGGGGAGSYGGAGGSGGNGGGSGATGGGAGGPTYGSQTDQIISMGSGAGGGGGQHSAPGAAGNPGQAGGAQLIVNAANAYIYGTVSFNGGTGGAGGYRSTYYGGGGGGGGSGGGVLFNLSGAANFTGATLRANGGPGGAGQSIGGTNGASGGGGRIKIFYGTSYTAPATLSAGTTYVLQLLGNASFSSTPSGSTIWIDGSNTGVTTPNTISNLATGGHSYTLKLSGYADVSGSFSVTANSTTTVPLVTFSGSAYITSTPSVARIYLAVSPGTPSDQGVYTPSTFTGLTAASAGSTTLWNYRLTLSGYADATGSFTATAGSTTSIPISFPPSASFTSVPTNARIWIDGVDKGINTPGTVTGLTAGSRNYTLKLTGYADATGSFTATAGSTTTVPTVTFSPSAYFNSTPSGSSIYVDNILQTGKTTPATITGLSTGSHSYKLYLAGYNAVTGNFNTTAGQTTTVPTILLSGSAMAFLSAGD